jgi:hypothetical protein
MLSKTLKVSSLLLAAAPYVHGACPTGTFNYAATETGTAARTSTYSAGGSDSFPSTTYFSLAAADSGCTVTCAYY